LQRLFAQVPLDQKQALRFDLAQPSGLRASTMNVDRLPEALAEMERARIDIDSVHFAWAGEDRPRRPHYYRLQGPSFLVEYDNTQDEANHIHAVWRSPSGDFGFDLLRGHVSRDH